MKILLIEDEERNIQSAMDQLGNNHNLIVLRSFFEYERFVNKHLEKVDFVLTDMCIPMGISMCNYDIEKRNDSKKLFSVGLAIAIFAANNGIPCGVLTDANSHNSVMGFALDLSERQTGFSPPQLNEIEDPEMRWKRKSEWRAKAPIRICTRPNWAGNDPQNGKDWMNFLQSYFKDIFKNIE